MLLAFEKLPRPVALSGCEDLAQVIADVLRGWEIRVIASPGAPQPAIAITKTSRGYRRTSPWLSKPTVFANKVNAVCDFLIDLIKYYISEDGSLLCLHCAAVQIGGGLVVFPSPYRAGKSTLAVHMAAAGMRLFADDVMAIDGSTGQGMASGILPRLRLPLSEGQDPAFGDFVSRRGGPKSSRFLYLNLEEDEVAPLGTSAPIIGFVLLQRREGGKTELIETPKSEILKNAILRNFSHEVAAIDVLDRLHALAGGAGCFTLGYASPMEGARLLGEAFGSA